MESRDKIRILKVSLITAFNLICLFSIIYCVATSAEKPQATTEEVKVIKEFEGPAPRASQPAQSQQAQKAPLASVKPAEKVFAIDDFEGDEVRNRLKGKANVYLKAPSRIMVTRQADVVDGKNTNVLILRYDKKNTGGPGGTGGWCGYYTLIKNEKTGQYIDASDYNYLTFWVKGEKGGENFMVGIADEHWDRMGDSLKSGEIGEYLPAGKVTTQWQKAKVPLSIFFLDISNLSSVSINFESDCFPDGAGAGTVFIDGIALEK